MKMLWGRQQQVATLAHFPHACRSRRLVPKKCCEVLTTRRGKDVSPPRFPPPVLERPVLDDAEVLAAEVEVGSLCAASCLPHLQWAEGAGDGFFSWSCAALLLSSSGRPVFQRASRCRRGKSSSPRCSACLLLLFLFLLYRSLPIQAPSQCQEQGFHQSHLTLTL